MNDAFIYVLSTNGLLFILSLIFWKFPPKKINSLYGYRTHKSMQNQEIWDFANTTFNTHLIKYTALSFVGGLLFAYLYPTNTSWQPMALVILSILVCIIKTERELKENFDENGKRK